MLPSEGPTVVELRNGASKEPSLHMTPMALTLRKTKGNKHIEKRLQIEGINLSGSSSGYSQSCMAFDGLDKQSSLTFLATRIRDVSSLLRRTNLLMQP